MPSNLITFETGFPTFTGEESAEQQIMALHNYLFQLREGLLYSLRNLTPENFNATALQNMTETQKNELTTMLKQMKDTVSNLSIRIDTISGRFAGIEKSLSSVESEIDRITARVDDNESAITGLQITIAENEEDLGDLADRVAAMEDELPQLEQAADELANLEDQVAEQEQSIRKIGSAVGIADDGSVTIGEPGRVVNLVGAVYINGIRFEQGETT